jgi:VanZ family protein
MIKKYKFSLVLSLVILILSLKSAEDLNKVQFLNIPHFDKFVHSCMYFALMSLLIYETRRHSLKVPNVMLLAAFPFIYGILLEILQSTVTTTRSGSFYDAAFNTLGIFLSILVWIIIRRVQREQIK